MRSKIRLQCGTFVVHNNSFVVDQRVGVFVQELASGFAQGYDCGLVVSHPVFSLLAEVHLLKTFS